MIGGTLDGKYRIVRLLGKGGMGTVYEGEASSGQRVAVKVMHPRGPHDSGDDAGHLGRFQREAKAASAIHSDHVASVLDWGTDPVRNAPYIVMEYLVGEDLHSLLKRVTVLEPHVALRIVAQACVGLQKAHEARVIHRDIKPANLYLARTGWGEVIVKILDFGIAKIRPEHAGSETTGLTRTGGMLGSPIYMSPEQARGIKAIDHRTDLWSLGVVLYRALSGHTPHDDTEALGELILSICSSVPRPIQEIAPWVPSEIASIAHGALRISPDERWPTAAATLDAIRPLLPDGFALREDMLVPLDPSAREIIAPRTGDHITTVATTLGRKAVVAASVAPAPAPRASLHEETGAVPASTTSPPRRRSGRTARLAAAAAIIAGATGTAVYWGSGARIRGGPRAAASPPITAAAAESPASAAPSANVAPSAAAAVPLSVLITVAPKDVTVLVDDAIAAVKEGVVEIHGTLGSVHRVRVSRGVHETSTNVVVTDTGAMPAKIDLVPAPAGAAGHPPAGKLPGTVAEKPAASGRPPANKPLMPDRFE